MSNPARPLPPKFGPWQFLILGMSCFALASLVAETFFPLSPDVRRILENADNAVCAVFLTDFLLRLKRAENKLAFMKWGWIDLISSLPMLDALRWGRMYRAIRILRVLRAIRSLRIIREFLFANRAHGTAASAAVISMFLVVICSIAVLQFEAEAEQANIKSGADAIWWCMTTITTVGYGDRFPVTVQGRVVGAILMTAGVGLFGILSGVIASWFLGNQEKADEESVSLQSIKADLEEIKLLLAARAENEAAASALTVTMARLDGVIPSPPPDPVPENR